MAYTSKPMTIRSLLLAILFDSAEDIILYDWPPDMPLEDAVAYLTKLGTIVYGIFDGDVLNGAVWIQPRGANAWDFHFWASQDNRYKAWLWGAEILEELRERHSISTYYACIPSFNRAARIFAEKMGFIPVDVFPKSLYNIRKNKKYDAHIFKKEV